MLATILISPALALLAYSGTSQQSAPTPGQDTKPASAQSTSNGASGSQATHGGAEAPPQPSVRDILGGYPDRPPAAKEVLDRGKAVYGVSCGFCHGSDAAGGEVGPNLIRSSVVLNDRNGELITPIVHGSRAGKGMPRIDISDAQISDIAAWLHSLKVSSEAGAPLASINIVTGTAQAGAADFKTLCSSCHSATGDLAGFASRFPEPRQLQQTWLLPGGGGPSLYGPAPSTEGLHLPPVTVTVTFPDGRKEEGELVRIDDFYVGINEKDGYSHGIARNGDNPKVEIHDPTTAHRKLFRVYTDKQIHDITAYLVTLK
ncbi:MAG: c-type cytochrome [Acidobacteriaceae bacterium]